MKVHEIAQVLENHKFFDGMTEAHLSELEGCAKTAHFAAQEVIFRQNEDADAFYIVLDGRIAVDVQTPDRGGATIQTLEAGDVLGWSWLFPPYEWRFDARAVEDTRVIAMDARCLRGKCEADPALGYDLMKRFSQIVIDRLQAQRIQLLDMFAVGS